VLETKGQEREVDKAKRDALQEWIKAINEYRGFGIWDSAISRDPSDLKGIIQKAAK